MVDIATGYLRIEAYNTDQQPVNDAQVNIYHTDMKAENMIYQTTTGADGRTEDIALDAPDISLSMMQSNERPYEQYHVEVIKETFDIEETRNVQVFPENGSTLHVELQPSMQDYQRRNIRILEDHKMWLAQVNFNA
ncbi:MULTISPECIES: carboxypeptidase regulatory-like domain-containing protein [Bacillota]|uniref:carboxypeptidase regulatory-like domain-containing protein n=1 Tax=Bacillota TaxID=1239 RepID=UPI000E3EF8A8|nr:MULTISPECIES: carboxypeptidase regulatory-like domain-containing protein [Bacillota]RGC48625.1 carboxypeptidase regulatory-like domain-containing protein [Absiella sp. AM29-15]RGB53319.1 carboxypeptidase regulatory-like domain-containing protein [Absiella sp. AM22-9]RGB59132.1 carboxypeptidase regulatory-like domain-containing protein [Absiella sp. AM10-20]RGB67386.1 carboxypeptidase regulatory-like domain-containing protein [Absiella sp. AM09-45]RGB76929.1 carboxypeptidase regulatory-like 